MSYGMWGSALSSTEHSSEDVPWGVSQAQSWTGCSCSTGIAAEPAVELYRAGSVQRGNPC